MDDGSRLSWIIAIILLFCAMFFAITETAFSASSRPRLKALGEMGNKKAAKALEILDDFERAISTILICTNIIHLSIASIVTVAVTKSIGLSAVAAATVITTMAVFFAGEMLPKSIAKKYPEQLAMFSAAPLKFFMTVFTPVSALLTAMGNGVSHVIKGEPELSVTEDEIYDIIEDMTEDGTLNEEQGELLSSALQFGEQPVESVLTHRMDVVAIDVEDSAEDILSTIKNCTHSRLPVYKGDIDHIIGILQIRKFIKAYLRDGSNLDVQEIADTPFVIKAGTLIDDALTIMRKNRQNIAVVKDSHSGTMGIVTVEDLVEVLVGEIWDEEDEVEKPEEAKNE